VPYLAVRTAEQELFNEGDQDAEDAVEATFYKSKQMSKKKHEKKHEKEMRREVLMTSSFTLAFNSRARFALFS
jgi:hypothetical protein